MKVIVDAMGGDNGVKANVEGSILALNEYKDIEVILVGNKIKIENELNNYEFNKNNIKIINTTNVISNDDEPAMAIRRKKDSSIVVGFNMLKDGNGDAFISAGNTGALLSGGILIVKRIKGIERAAIATVYPTQKGISLLIDAGANVDCKPQYLQQFAIMGSIYCEKVLNIHNPKVAMVNIGTEMEKGNLLVKESYSLLHESNINFIGNIEARDIPYGYADVIVCDGFVGNVILKLTEGIAFSMFSVMKKEFLNGFWSKTGAYLLKPKFKNIKNIMDYREYGGAPLLGIKKPVIKAHGSSDGIAIKNAIGQAKLVVENKIIDKIENEIKKDMY
jgi:glycerol-3-phosphate acyltransferase PlsX